MIRKGIYKTEKTCYNKTEKEIRSGGFGFDYGRKLSRTDQKAEIGKEDHQ